MKSVFVLVFACLLMIQCIQDSSSSKTKVKEVPTRHSATWVYKSLAGNFQAYHLVIHRTQTDSGYLFQSCQDTSKNVSDTKQWSKGGCDSIHVVESKNDRWEFKELRANFLRDTIRFVAEGHRHFMVQGKTYDTYRFSLQNPPIDGRSIRFWEPSIGIFLHWSPDWGDELFLENHEGIDSLALAELIHSVKQDTLFFTRGIIKE
jgi:hypothetical protein